MLNAGTVVGQGQADGTGRTKINKCSRRQNKLLEMRENTELQCRYDGDRLNSLVMRDWKVCLCTEANDEPDYQQVWIIKKVRCGRKPSPHRHT